MLVKLFRSDLTPHLSALPSHTQHTKQETNSSRSVKAGLPAKQALPRASRVSSCRGERRSFVFFASIEGSSRGFCKQIFWVRDKITDVPKSRQIWQTRRESHWCPNLTPPRTLLLIPRSCCLKKVLDKIPLPVSARTTPVTRLQRWKSEKSVGGCVADERLVPGHMTPRDVARSDSAAILERVHPRTTTSFYGNRALHSPS